METEESGKEKKGIIYGLLLAGDKREKQNREKKEPIGFTYSHKKRESIHELAN